ncbi:MAG TPA: DUF6265 family protein [Steroidobacteraceae bacterium]|jgi:hypothetical protein|nr:DUF6265 family protein [Steroidobacteraceae bacterium]
MHTRELLILGLLAACTAAAGDTSTAAPDFGWFTGNWCAESGGEFIEEHWLSARGDLMLGMSRTVKAGKTVSFEFLRIQRDTAMTNYLAQPQGAPPTAFRLTGAGANWARFENAQHDFPQRVEYRRTPTGLHAEIAGPGKQGGEIVIPFEYRACPVRGGA